MYNQPIYYMRGRTISPVGPVGRNFQDDRVGGFLVPFLLGGLGGAAVVGLSRPRPVYVNQPYGYQYYPYQYGPYGY